MTAPALEALRVPLDPFNFPARLAWPAGSPRGGVVLAHGSGVATTRPELEAWARALAAQGHAVLLVDLLTGEEQSPRPGRRDRREVGFLAGRLVVAGDFLAARLERGEGASSSLPLSLWGEGTALAAAIVAATERPGRVTAVVGWQGRPALAGPALSVLRAPLLLIEAAEDQARVEEARAIVDAAAGPAELVTRPRAGLTAAVPGLAIAWMTKQRPLEGEAVGEDASASAAGSAFAAAQPPDDPRGP